MGAGAVGSYYGALLARAGHEVTLVSRGAHQDALATQGFVRVREQDGPDWSAPVQTHPDVGRHFDLIIISTKSQHTKDVAQQARAHVGDETIVLSLQNGTENLSILRATLGPHAHLVGGIAFVGLRVDRPGEVYHQAEGWVTVGDARGGPTPVVQRLMEILSDAWDATVTTDIRREQWFKLLWNIGFNAICAITGAGAGQVLATPESRRLVRDAMFEVVALANAEGVTITDDDVERMASYNPGLRDYLPSTAQDIAAGKPVERDALTGFVVRAGARHGIDVPVNRVLDGLLALQQDRATGHTDELIAAIEKPAGDSSK